MSKNLAKITIMITGVVYELFKSVVFFY